MKNNILKVVIAALLGNYLLASCVDDFKVGDAFLEKPPGVAINEDSIFHEPNMHGRIYGKHTIRYIHLIIRI